MKRFVNASYIKFQVRRILVAAMLAVAALALVGKVAHALAAAPL